MHQALVPAGLKLQPFVPLAHSCSRKFAVANKSLSVTEENNWTGKSLIDLGLTTFGVMVVAIKKKGEKDYEFVPAADRILEQGDTLVAIGKESDLLELKS